MAKKTTAKSNTPTSTNQNSKVDSMVSNPIAIWPNLSRAIEIAKLSGNTISFYFKKDYKNGFSDYKFISWSQIHNCCWVS